MGVGSLKLYQRFQGWWPAQGWFGCMVAKRGGSGAGRGKGGRGGMSKRNVLVMKCNKRVDILYCGKYLSVNIRYCNVPGIVTITSNIART